VDILFPNPDIPLGKILDNITSRGIQYAIVVTHLNEQHRSLTLNVLHGQQQVSFIRTNCLTNFTVGLGDWCPESYILREKNTLIFKDFQFCRGGFAYKVTIIKRRGFDSRPSP